MKTWSKYNGKSWKYNSQTGYCETSNTHSPRTLPMWGAEMMLVLIAGVIGAYALSLEGYNLMDVIHLIISQTMSFIIGG